MQVLHNNPHSTGNAMPVDTSRLKTPAEVTKVVCGSDYAAVLLASGEVYSCVVIQKQQMASSVAASPQQQQQQKPILCRVARLKGLKVVDIAATAVSIVALAEDRSVHTVSTVSYQKEAARFALPLRALKAAEASSLKGALKYSSGHASTPPLQVSAGAVFFVFACKATASVWAGGINQSGQLGIGSDDEKLEVAGGELREVRFAPPLAAPVHFIVCGGCHAVALVPMATNNPLESKSKPREAEESSDANVGADAMPECCVWVWGRNTNGQLGVPASGVPTASSPVLLEGVSAVSAACGDYFTVLLSRREGGSIGVCGKNTSRQLGLPDADPVTPIRWLRLSAVLPPPQACALLSIASVACGGAFGAGHTILTTVDGSVFGWGSNAYGQLGTLAEGKKGEEKEGAEGGCQMRPLAVPQAWAGRAVEASCGWMHSVVWCRERLAEEAHEERPVSSSSSKAALSINSSGNGRLESLPLEVLDRIISYLPRGEALRGVSRASTTWRELVAHCDALWEATLQRRFPLSSERIQQEAAEEKRRRGGYVPYGEGVDYVSTLGRLVQERYGTIMSHPEEDSVTTGVENNAASGSGGIFSNLWGGFTSLLGRSKIDSRILILGLDAAGKTTLLYRLKLGGEVITTIPTIGFNVETITHNNMQFTCWDVGGPDKLRALWRHYFEGTQGIVFVVDGADEQRLCDAVKLLRCTLREDLLSKVAVLVLVNKMDLSTCMPFERVAKEVRDALLSLHSTSAATAAVAGGSGSGRPARHWCVQGVSGKEGHGIHKGFDWLAKVLARPS